MVRRKTTPNGTLDKKNEKPEDKSENLTENLRYKTRLNLQRLVLTKLIEQDLKSNPKDSEIN
jgi:hypothetical protein